MGKAQEKAASYYAPMAQATPTDGSSGLGTVRFATSSTADSQALNTDVLQDGRTVYPWRGKYVNFKNEDLFNPLDVAFSVGAVTLVYGQTAASFAAGSAVAGWRLMPGEERSEMCPNDATHFNYVQPSGAVAATVALRLSEREVGNK